MIRRLACIFALTANAVSAQQPLLNLEETPCVILSIHLETDGVLAPAIEDFLTGVYAGAQASAEGVPSFASAILGACRSDSSRSIGETIRAAIAGD